MLLDKLEDNETSFNDEFLCPLNPVNVPETMIVSFSIEDWQGNSIRKSITVNFKLYRALTFDMQSLFYD